MIKQEYFFLIKHEVNLFSTSRWGPAVWHVSNRSPTSITQIERRYWKRGRPGHPVKVTGWIQTQSNECFHKKQKPRRPTLTGKPAFEGFHVFDAFGSAATNGCSPLVNAVPSPYLVFPIKAAFDWSVDFSMRFGTACAAFQSGPPGRWDPPIKPCFISTSDS